MKYLFGKACLYSHALETVSMAIVSAANESSSSLAKKVLPKTAQVLSPPLLLFSGQL